MRSSDATDRAGRMTSGIKTAVGLFILGTLLAGCSPSPTQTHPGFGDDRYSKIGADGQPADPSATAWPCALDKFTGLLWEVKTDTTGLHDWRNTYSWYDPDESNDPGGLDYRGTAGGGECTASDCDTWAYPRAVNEIGRCGYKDWRVPVRDELASLTDRTLAESPPTINVQIFPHAQPDEYWSRNDYHFQHDASWLWSFQFGHDRVEWKKSPRRVRLVRGEAQYLTPVKD